MAWDTARGAERWRFVARLGLSDVVSSDGLLRPLPWRVCGRAVGRTLSFKVWLPRERRKPSWRDPVHSRQVRVPRPYAAPGTPGWYVGHLPAGSPPVYERLSTR